MELKELLGKYVEADKVEALVDEINKELPKSYIPKTRFNEVNEELKIIKVQLEESKEANKVLTEKTGSIEELQKKLEDVTAKNIEIEKTANDKIASITKRTQLKELLVESNVHQDAVELLVDKYLNDVEIEEGKIKEATKLIEKIKQEKSGLFLDKKIDSTNKGGKTPPPTDDESALRSLFGLPPKK